MQAEPHRSRHHRADCERTPLLALALAQSQAKARQGYPQPQGGTDDSTCPCNHETLPSALNLKQYVVGQKAGKLLLAQRR